MVHEEVSSAWSTRGIGDRAGLRRPGVGWTGVSGKPTVKPIRSRHQGSIRSRSRSAAARLCCPRPGPSLNGTGPRLIRRTASPTAPTWSAPIRTPARGARVRSRPGRHHPLIVHFDGMTFDGTTWSADARLAGVRQQRLRLHAGRDRGRELPNDPKLIQGAGGPLSQADRGWRCSFQDATMRAQFDKVGAGSGYHLILHPNVLPAVTINVPQNQGTLMKSPQGVIFPTIKSVVVRPDQQPGAICRRDAPPQLRQQRCAAGPGRGVLRDQLSRNPRGW